MHFKLALAFLFTFFFIGNFEASASITAYEFETKEQEARFQKLVAVLRCPTCQNQNLNDSNSMVADDLKQIVYEKIIAGESDEAIVSFMKQRYGEFILYEPEMSGDNLLLWTGPFIFFGIFLFSFIVWYLRRREVVNEEPVAIAETDSGESKETAHD